MATSIQSSRWLSTTDELFREWGKAISDGIRSVGLVQTEDTGQIDWAAAEAVTGANAVAGYEVWRFDDALQTTHPVYIRLEYGNGYHLSEPGMWITIGRATDGAGEVSGVLAPRRRWNGGGTSTSGGPGLNQSEMEPIHISSDGSSLCVVPRIRGSNTIGSASHVGALVIDRSRDSAGNPTAAGGVILTEGFGG